MKIKGSIVILLAVACQITSCGFSGTKKDTKLTAAVTNTPSKTAKPNIIYILADDLGYGDLSVYGQQKFSTPNIDKLAAQGMLFTQHYSGSTVCAPSRSALLTGQHTGHTFIRGNKEIQPEGQYPLPDSSYTLAEVMKDAGYTTGAFGKWGLGFPGSEGDPTNQGFDTFYGYNCQRLGHKYYPEYLWSNRDTVHLAKNKNFANEIYAPTLIHEQSLQFLEKNKDNPFFLYVASIIPHAELAAPEALMKKYRGKFVPEKGFKANHTPEEYRNGAYQSQDEGHAAFAAMVDLLDQQVGEIVKKVDDLGIADNTLIIFTSDNGPHKEGGADPNYFDSNGPLRGAKRDLYEGGIRVPMIARWSNKIKPNTKSDHISAFWDVFPTMAAVSNQDVSQKNIDGVSFLPALLGDSDSQKEHEYLYWEFHEKGGRQAVRKAQWKAVKYNVLKKPNAPLELYDLSKDIGERNNVAANYPEIVEEMNTILKEARTNSNVFTFDQTTFLEVK